jgi:deaminated glutathione amidase
VTPTSRTLRVAAVQLTTGADVAPNLIAAERLVREGADRGARLVVLPEKWPSLDVTGSAPAQGLDGPWLSAARDWARSLGIWLLAGSILESVSGETRAYNTSVLISPTGEDAASYRKIHLFDVEVGGHTYRESATAVAGASVATGLVDGVRVGLSICYDLRFPELYRALADRGADVLAVPSAFTETTGRAHWEVLLRARAIENQAVVIAANQVGQHANGTSSYGHSMIVDPWGTILAEASDGPGVVAADLDLDQFAEIRERLPALKHRRGDVFNPRGV